MLIQKHYRPKKKKMMKKKARIIFKKYKRKADGKGKDERIVFPLSPSVIDVLNELAAIMLKSLVCLRPPISNMEKTSIFFLNGVICYLIDNKIG